MEDYYASASSSPYQEGNPKRVDTKAVEGYTLDDFGITIDQVKLQLFGIKVVDPETGKSLPDRYYQMAINSAVAWVEKRFDVKILPRFVTEEKDFYQNEASDYLYQSLIQRPVLQVEDFKINMYGSGFINFPSKWWKVNTLTASLQVTPGFGLNAGYLYGGNFGGQGLSDLARLGYALNYSSLSLGGNESYAPQYFHINYVAGMLPPARAGVEQDWEMPEDLKFVILKKAAQDVLQIFGWLVMNPGVAAQSITMDGITQSKTSTASAMYGGASADILQLQTAIDSLSAGLDAKYGTATGML